MVKEFEVKESYCGLVNFYEQVARAMGYEVTDNTFYDCTKIEVAKNIADNIFDYYETEYGMPKETMGMNWVCYGPKTKEDFADNTVRVEDGFAYEGGEEE